MLITYHLFNHNMAATCVGYLRWKGGLCEVLLIIVIQYVCFVVCVSGCQTGMLGICGGVDCNVPCQFHHSPFLSPRHRSLLSHLYQPTLPVSTPPPRHPHSSLTVQSWPTVPTHKYREQQTPPTWDHTHTIPIGRLWKTTKETS